LEVRNDKHEGLIKKLVSNARAIISDQVGLSVGAGKMRNILIWLKPYETVRIAEVDVFEKYDERTRFIPHGTARLHCSPEAFEKYNAALEEVNQRLRKKILKVCFEIIEKYDDRVKLSQ
jgi:hypothetical protein